MHYGKLHALLSIVKGDFMAMLTVRNLPDDVHRALRVRAAERGHSTEAEVRDILATVVKPQSRVLLGDALADVSRKLGLTNADFDALAQVRDKMPAQPMSFDT